MQPDNSKRAINALYWRDEILQVLYWMDGEDLASHVRPADLCTLLNGTEAEIAFHLAKLADEGYVDRDHGVNGHTGQVRYSLSALGKKEGGRRFVDAFEGMQNQGHGECSADCDCNWVDGGHSPHCKSHRNHQHKH